MDIAKFASALDILYTDDLTIYALVNDVNSSDGTVNNVISNVIKDSSKCRLSYRRIDVPYENNEKGEPIRFETKIICPPGVNVTAGDWLIISRMNGLTLVDTVIGYAGYPAKFGTHQEVILIHKGRA